jgi:hypothetical protein
VPSLPRGRRGSPGPDAVPRPAPAASQRPVPTLRYHLPSRSYYSRGINEGSRDSPVRSALTRDPRMEQESFGFSLRLRTLPLPATHAKGGARHRAHARNYTTDITSALLTASPLAKCDFVSQRHVSEPGRTYRRFSQIRSHDRGAAGSYARACPRRRVTQCKRSATVASTAIVVTAGGL